VSASWQAVSHVHALNELGEVGFFLIQTVEGVTRLFRFCLRPVLTETMAGLAVLHRELVIANRADSKTKFGHFSSAASNRDHPA